MSTIVIEMPDSSSRRFEIDLANEPKELVEEFCKFVKKLEARAGKSKKNGLKSLSPKLKRASEYLDTLADRPASKASLAEADEIRKDWIRKNV